MKIALYGLPCAGKSTLLETASGFIKTISGYKLLQNIQGDIFEKRRTLLNQLSQETEFLIDGHYQFITEKGKETVFTFEDKVFDVFMYLYQKPELIYERMKESEKNQKYIPQNISTIIEWQLEEINSLREICHRADKDFYVIDDYETNYKNFTPFLKDILNGYSNVNFARTIFESINIVSDSINIFDGDKTLIPYDSSKYLLNFTTNIFDNNIYTGYQFWLQDKYIKPFLQSADLQNIKKIEYTSLKEQCIENKSIILSSGIPEIWEDNLGKELGVKTFAGKYISADTKYFVVKFLKKKYNVTAYGDSKNDLYMLKEADKGFLIINEHLSRSLSYSEIENLNIINLQNNLHILDQDKSINSDEIDEINSLIKITKSDSGIIGNRLAEAHFQLGKKLCRYLQKYKPEETTILSIERSGRFLADGLYMSFNAKFESYNSSHDMPKIETDNIILVDGVINNGKTIIDIIKKIEHNSKVKRIIILTNVINKEAVSLFKAYKLIAVRISENKYTGRKVKVQSGNIGPDTSDRLFNQL
ncbi:uracil phosphoribosyltransferase [Treponema denticola]|uniref:uracil phosphoribosyltransferase n=1 Tax=Treponema denticola TaxID=158 RepID=UPI0020A42E1D|nr:hypothetical protein [Treponema denticola]UTC81973.1 hypothetical protein HGJ18_01680 [Treponema denticola]